MSQQMKKLRAGFDMSFNGILLIKKAKLQIRYLIGDILSEI